jgi:hypothetical protein
MYLSQTEIGGLFGVTCKVIGDWLIEVGLRTEDRKPSRKAFEGGFVSQSALDSGGYYYKWDGEKTIKALEEGGRRRKTPVSSGRIEGPFTARRSSENGYEILSGDGSVSVWIVGEWNANIVTRILNLAYQHGKFGGNHPAT